MKLPRKVVSKCLKKLAIIVVVTQAMAEGSPVGGLAQWKGSGDWWHVLGNRSQATEESSTAQLLNLFSLPFNAHTHIYTHAHTHTHACTHKHTHACTHINTPSQSLHHSQREKNMDGGKSLGRKKIMIRILLQRDILEILGQLLGS